MGMLKPAAVFGSHMVLQRGKPVNIFGTGINGRTVSVSFCGKTSSAEVRGHKWNVVLPPQDKYAADLTAVISDGTETVIFSDIAIGEVWLAGGQSNMELELQNSKDGKEELKNCGKTNVRFYYTKKNAFFDDYFYADEENGGWQLPSESSSGCWSAVGYYFGKKLSEDLKCTVGIIGCNWGGTSASAWISRKYLVSDPDTKTYVDELDEAVNSTTPEQYLADREEYFSWEEKWQAGINEYYSLHTDDASWEDAQKYAGGPCRYPEPLGFRSPFRAGGLYETMLQRVCPYTLAGFMYYQGESDDHKPDTYYKLLKMLIEQWRSDWNDDTLPFLFVQLPMHRYKDDEDKKNWCIIREAQMRVHLTTANTGLAVILDKGEFNNIHPVDKKDVGYRLEMQALCHVYGRLFPEDAYGPVYKYSYAADGGMYIIFDYGDGMYSDGELTGFEAAGADGVYFPAKARIIKDTVFIRSDNVKDPRSARYQWVNYGKVTLFGRNGIPAAPFRSKR